MKSLIKPKKLQCNLDNPLAPTVATLHLPEMELLAETCQTKGKSYQLRANQSINVELNRSHESTVSSFESKLFNLNNSEVSEDELTLELESANLGLHFKVGLNKEGQVKNVVANWARAS